MVQKGPEFNNLCNFITKEMKLPFHMHAVHRNVMLAVYPAIMNAGASTVSLQFVLSLMRREFPFKPQWMSFAADTAVMYTSGGGHFVEKSEEARFWKKFEQMCVYVLTLDSTYLILSNQESQTHLRLLSLALCFHFLTA